MEGSPVLRGRRLTFAALLVFEPEDAGRLRADVVAGGAALFVGNFENPEVKALLVVLADELDARAVLFVTKQRVYAMLPIEQPSRSKTT